MGYIDRHTAQQGQLDPSLIVLQLTLSNEVMQHLGEVLAGPLMCSLQSAGAILASTQPSGLAAHTQPLAQAGPAQFVQWPGIQFPGFGGYSLMYIPGEAPHQGINPGGQPSSGNNQMPHVLIPFP